MKTGIMVLKAILVITIFTGLAHFVAQISNQTPVDPLTYYDYKKKQNWESSNVREDTSGVRDNKALLTQPTHTKATLQHPLLGYWFVTYDELEIGVTYEFRKDEGRIKAFSIEIYDKEGNKMTDNTPAMTVKSFEGADGVADYFMEYQGKKYEVESRLKLVDNKLEVSYYYDGYEGKEIWKKVTK